jgi:hypothetical protein
VVVATMTSRERAILGLIVEEVVEQNRDEWLTKAIELIRTYVRRNQDQALKVAALLDSVSQALKDEHAAQKTVRARRQRHSDP